MNNRKEQIKKAAAFVSALSFMSVTNFSGLNNPSAMMISKVSAVNSTDDTDGLDINVSDETVGQPQTTTTVQTATTVATTDTSTTVTTVSTTTTAETTTTTTTAETPDNPSTDIKELTVITTKKELIDSFIDEIKREMSDLFLSDNINKNGEMIYLKYTADKERAYVVDELKKRFSYVTEECIYNCFGASGLKISEGYYRVYNTNGIIDVSGDNVRNENNKIYLKSGNIGDSVKVKENNSKRYKLVEKENLTASDKSVDNTVYIDNETVKIGNKVVFSIVENNIVINFNTENVNIGGIENQISVNLSEIDSKTITLTCDKGYSKIKIGDSSVADNGVTLSIKDLLEKAGYTVTGNTVTDNNGGEVTEATVSAVAISSTVKIECTIMKENKEETEELACEIKNNQILLPLMIKKDGLDYYLSGYSYPGINKSNLKFDDICKELEISSYKGVPYSGKVYATYSRVPASEIEVSKEDVINALTLADGNECSVRNDSVINFNIPIAVLDFSIHKEDGEELSEDEKKREEQLKNLILVFESDMGKSEIVVINDNLTSNLHLDDIKFYKLVSILDSQNKSVSFADPLYIYLDRQDPKVEVPEEYQNTESWSTDVFEFEFSVSDGESIEGVPEDLKGDYEKINNNPDLKSVKSIKIDGTIFYRNNDGEWVKDNENTSQDENTSVSIAKPTFSKDENGTTEGTFKVTFTSKNSIKKTIDISATDNCGNTSDIGRVNVKIDKEAPAVSRIDVKNIENNNIQGDTLDVSANITDASSGIKTVVFKYADKEFGANYDENEKKYKGTLEITENDLSSKIQVIVTDNAGNEKTYYYKADEKNGNVIEDETGAADVVMDKEAPKVNVSAPEKVDYEEIIDDKNKKCWYKNYPRMSIVSSDNKGIKDITIKINGKPVVENALFNNVAKTALNKTDINELTADDIKKVNENLELVFVPLDDNQQFNVNVSIGGENSYPLTTEFFSLEDGKLQVEVSVKDYGGKLSSESTDSNENEIVYIDNTAPITSGVIECDNAENNYVNFKSFGTFASKKVTVKVKLSDSFGASSGIKPENININFNNENYNAEKIANENETDYAYFVVPYKDISENSSITGAIKLTATDNVGNKLIFENKRTDNILVNDIPDNNGIKNVSNVTIERQAPVIEFTVKGENRYDNGKEVWYNSDVTVECTVKDDKGGDSGLASVDFTREQERANEKVVNANYVNDGKMLSTKYENKLSTEKDSDGKAVFSISAIDNAGNTTTDGTTIYKDITLPSITGFDFYNPVLSRSPVNIIMGRIEHFGYFFDSATSMTVYAEDNNASSGMKSIYCRLVNSDGTVFSEENVVNPSYSDGKYYAEFEIPEGFKGDILAWAVDNVNNKSSEVSPDGLASENQGRHDSHASIAIEIPQTEYSDTSGLPLYSNDVTASVVIDDDFSGIRTVEWTTSDFDGWQRIDIDDNGNIYGDSDGWSVDRSERNIALSVSNNITVSRDSNDNIIIVRITDNSGNVSENEVNFSIDKQAPVIAVSGIEQSQGVKYYNSDKQAHIVISERNFNSPMVNGKPESFQDDPDSPAGTDNFRHIKDIVYNSDGTYSLEIENTDLAGNVANKYSSGTFVIDKTAPVLEVGFSKQSGGKADPKKNSYINDVVSAVISVEELNFDSGRVSVKINGKEYTPEEWKEENGKHTAVIPYDEFKKDGEYTVSVSGTDLASNAFKSYSASFVIDTESPEIEFSGFATANKGEVAPVIKIDDLNLDEYELNVYRNSKLCKMSYDSAKKVYSFEVSDNNDCITGKWIETTVDGKVHKEFVFDNFPSDECFDGLYSIDVSATDKAENVSNDMRKFSVNRFGSVFEVENIENIDGKYLNKAPNISITETNVDKHKEGSEIIVILDKGSVTEQLDETMYEVSEPEMLDDKSGYVYKYVIKAGNFNQDLDYRISIQTIDEAGNKNVSTGRGAEFGFNVDTHDPEFKCDELVERAEFRESEKTFRINVNEKLKHITVTTSLDEVLLDFDADDDDRSNNSYTFVMPASNTSRSVTVELTDLAGNKTVETFNNLLITENMFLYLFHKTWIKVTGGIALLGIGTVGGFTITGKKRRRRN